jgi:hypothetical protein
MESEAEELGDRGIELKGIETFEVYKAINDELRAKTIVTQFDEEALEAARNEYTAVKKAKNTVAVTKAKRQIELTLKDSGAAQVKKEVDKENDNL